METENEYKEDNDKAKRSYRALSWNPTMEKHRCSFSGLILHKRLIPFLYQEDECHFRMDLLTFYET